MRTLLAACALVIGCNRPPDHLADCRDEACQTAWVVAQWGEDPAKVQAELGALPDPLAQVALVQALAEAYPGKTGQLCSTLPMGPGRERCQKLNERPHLWQIAVTSRSDQDASAPQPTAPPAPGAEEQRMETDEETPEVRRTLRPSVSVGSPWADLQPRVVPCEGAQKLCQTEAAWSAAMAGDAPAAEAACRGIDAPKWAYECIFQSAEMLQQTLRADRAADAIGLCLAATPYVNNCLLHLSRRLAALAPPAGSEDAADWAPLLTAATETHARIAAQDADLAKRFRDRLLAEALRFAYDGAPSVTGLPFDRLPPEATPHIHAAAIWRLLSLEGSQGRDLAEWLERIDAALADRQPVRTPRPQDRNSYQAVALLWPVPLPTEAALNTVPYLGEARRVTVSDDQLDRLICLLEAAARLGSPRQDLLNEALAHPEPLVRWTALRLLQSTNAPAQDLVELRRDKDPLVRARAARSSERPP